MLVACLSEIQEGFSSAAERQLVGFRRRARGGKLHRVATLAEGHFELTIAADSRIQPCSLSEHTQTRKYTKGPKGRWKGLCKMGFGPNAGARGRQPVAMKLATEDDHR